MIIDRSDSDCFYTARGLTELGRGAGILPVPRYREELDIQEGRILNYIEPEKLKTIDDIIEKNRINNGNPLILVTNLFVARVYPAHYWNKVLRGRGGVKPLEQGEAVAFNFAEGDSSFFAGASCQLLPRRGR